MKNLKTTLSVLFIASSFLSFGQIWSWSGGLQTLSNANGLIGTTSNHSLQFTTNNINRFNIHSGGNIGVGTTNAQRRMHIHGTGPILAEMGSPIPPPQGTESMLVLTNTESGNTAWDGLRVGLQGNVAMLATLDKIRLDVMNGPSILSFRPEGKITMFTSAFNYDAKFAIRAGNDNAMFIDNSNNTTGYSLRVQVNNANVDVYSVQFGTGLNNIKYVVKGDGRVGIGTNAPSVDYLLDVAGKARACEVRVNNPGWCDYVFEPDYQLMPLSDLKDFLAQNKHLPEMPSEKQVVEAGGFDLAQMNVALLKRSEENTLYILELEEKINKLTSALEAQAKILHDLSTKTQDNE